MDKNLNNSNQLLYFNLHNTQHINCSNIFEITSSFHCLIIFLSGSGTLYTNKKSFALYKGKTFLFTPNTDLKIENTSIHDLEFYFITYTAFKTNHLGQSTPYTKEIFKDENEFSIYPFTRLIRLGEELHKNSNEITPIIHLQNQSKFYDLLLLIYTQHESKDYTDDNVNGVKNTIDLINEKYYENFNVKYLSQLANIDPWKYSKIFQTLTGEKPLNYLTSLRIKHAKNLLEYSTEPLRRIAQHVGFNDEYYFSRCFSKIVGMPPKQYARLNKQKTLVNDWTGHTVEVPVSPKRIIYHSESFGDLLVLGVNAIASNKSSLEKTFFNKHTENIEDVGFPLNTEKAISLKPDLIIFTSANEREYNKIRKIAPTITHNSWDPLNKRLITLGTLIGKKQEAINWLSYYNAKEIKMWKSLIPNIKQGETASIFTITSGNRLFILSSTGPTASLYHPLGFKPVKPVTELLALDLGYKEVSPENLPFFSGDRIFFIIYDDIDENFAKNKLTTHPLWNSIPAVQNGYAYFIKGQKWLNNDAYTMNALLDEIPLLLNEKIPHKSL